MKATKCFGGELPCSPLNLFGGIFVVIPYVSQEKTGKELSDWITFLTGYDVTIGLTDYGAGPQEAYLLNRPNASFADAIWYVEYEPDHPYFATLPKDFPRTNEMLIPPFHKLTEEQKMRLKNMLFAYRKPEDETGN